MEKRGKWLFILNATILEVLLLISLSFSISLILSGNYVTAQADLEHLAGIKSVTAGSGADTATQAAAKSAAEKVTADTTTSTGPLEGLKAGVGKVFSGEARLGLGQTSTTGAFVGTLIGALALA